MKKLLQEPLLHFLLIGGLLFGIGALLENDDPASDPTIVVSPGRIEALRQVFLSSQQREPTRKELEEMIDQYVREEVFNREAMVRGLDRDDPIIRNRLEQVMEMFAEESLEITQPTETQLREHLEANRAQFRIDPTFTFEQRLFNKGNREEAAAAVTQLNEGTRTAEETGEPTLLPTDYEAATESRLDATFGVGFSERVAELPLGKWAGPLESARGLHVIRLQKTEPARLPEFEKIREELEADWVREQRRQARGRFEEQLLEPYEVIIEWPEQDS